MKIGTSNRIIIVDEQSSEKPSELQESENIGITKYLDFNSQLNKISSTEKSDRPFHKNVMPRSQSNESVSCDDEILKKLEAAKKLAQNEAEISAAITSLQTNLILCSIFVITFIILPVLNQMFGIIVVSFMKGFVPILTTISNFGKIKSLVYSFCKI